jgi:hypothetical protein
MKINDSKENLWICNYAEDAEYWKATEFFDTKEEAIEAGRAALTLAELGVTVSAESVFGTEYEVENANGKFVVGKLSKPSVHIDGNWVLEDLQEQVYSQCGESGESFLESWSEDESEELTDELNKVMQAWLTKHNKQPMCYVIDNCETITVNPTEIK